MIESLKQVKNKQRKNKAGNLQSPQVPNAHFLRLERQKLCSTKVPSPYPNLFHFRLLSPSDRLNFDCRIAGELTVVIFVLRSVILGFKIVYRA